MAAKVFISYRREDSRYQARMIHSAFCKAIPSDHVFMDVDTIRPGTNFRKTLKGWVDECEVLLALIGPGWMDARDPKTKRRRLDNKNDFVRIEIGEALARGIPVVPVLLDDTEMPDIGRLPEDLKELVDRQAEFVQYRTFEADVERLIRKLGLSQAAGRTGLPQQPNGRAGDEKDAQAILMDYLADDFETQQGVDLRKDSTAMQRLKDAAAKAVHELSSIHQTDINLPFIAADATGPRHLSMQLTRTTLDLLVTRKDSSKGSPQQPISAPAPALSAGPYSAEGRIKVEAAIVHGASDGWFLPGNGKEEWFKDTEAGPEMVVVPAGKFMMGSPETEAERNDYESPQHPVTIARPFAIGRHIVTRAQFAAFVHDTSYVGHWWSGDWWRNPGFPQNDSHPVVYVNWKDDAKAYLAWLSSQTGRQYRLPTEAEWEYAARAGTTTPYWWGSSITPAQAHYREHTVAVGEFAASPWGLYQVHGNVWEWCEDVWHQSYNGAPSDGSAFLKGEPGLRVIRGGSKHFKLDRPRAAARAWYNESNRMADVSLRVARTLTP